jgi:hypothetical protein
MDTDGPSDIQWVYEIKVEGHLDERWSDSLSGFALTVEEAGPEKQPATVLRGVVADQAALRGILTTLWDLNLALISLTRLASDGGCGQSSDR